MGVDISTWRQRIGTFKCRCLSRKINMSPACHFYSHGIDSALMLLLVAAVIEILLVVGCVEMNPGPTKKINGRDYEHVDVRSDGACVFRSLAYCLCGDQDRFIEIINDCVAVFQKYDAQLYYSGCDFSKRGNVEQYMHFMDNGVAKLLSGQSVTRDGEDLAFWGEDAHIRAVSLLYDICIYVYNACKEMKEWHVFNKEGCRGFICLLNDGGHMSVLLCDKNNIMPPKTKDRGILEEPSRKSFGWNPVYDNLRNSSFSFVHVVPMPQNGGQSMQSIVGSAFVSQNMSKSVKQNSKNVTNVCQVCQQCFKNSRALNMHNLRMHSNLSQVHEFKSLSNSVEDSEVPLPIGHSTPSKCPQDRNDSSSFCFSNISVCADMDQGSCPSIQQQLSHIDMFDTNNSSSVSSILSSVPKGKTQCPQCRMFFVDLSKHKHCRSKYSSSIAPEGNVTFVNRILRSSSGSCSVTDMEDVSVASSQHMANVSPDHGHVFPIGRSKEKIQCPQCLKFFVDLSKHKKCRSNSSSSSAPEGDFTFVNRILRFSSSSSSQNVSEVEDDYLDSCQQLTNVSADNDDVFSAANLSATTNKHGKIRCPNCNNWYKSLKNHKKCSKRSVRSVQSTAECALLDVNSNSSVCSDTSFRIPVGLPHSVSSSRLYSVDSTVNCRDNFAQLNVSSNLIHGKQSVAVRKRLTKNKQMHSTDNTTAQFVQDQPRSHCSNKKLDYYYQLKLQDIKKIRSQFKEADKKLDVEFEKLSVYVASLSEKLTDISTRRCSDEMKNLISDPTKIGDEQREQVCTEADLKKLADMCKKVTNLTQPEMWTWDSKTNTNVFKYNQARMSYWNTEEIKFKVLERCKKCSCTDILMGHECGSLICRDCMKVESYKSTNQVKKDKAWQTVKPPKDFPKRVDQKNVDLPDLSVAEKAVIAPVQPVVTVTKNFYAQKKLRQECITLTQDPDHTWACILPRTDLKSSHVMIEKTARDKTKKYLVANKEHVQLWLNKFFNKDVGHDGILQMQRDGKLTFCDQALAELEKGAELAEVDELCEETEQLRHHENRVVGADNDGLAQASMQPVFNKHHTFSFQKLSGLYLKMKDALKIKREGKIQVIEDNTVRTPAFHISPTMAFPHLYPEKGQKAPADLPDPKEAADMMRKQMLYPLTTDKGKLRWWAAEDDIHMMHQYAAIQERLVNSKVGFVMGQHPETAQIPIDQLIEILKKGADDQGLIDSKMPNLTQVMAQLPNSREHWFAERLGLEAMSRDCGRPNCFATFNTDCRNWDHTRRLLYKLEQLSNPNFKDPAFENWYPNIEQWTQLVDKYAVFLVDYIQRVFQTFFEAFFCDVCGVPRKQPGKGGNTENGDPTSPEMSWWWNRVEFTETRGMPHWHCLIKLPHVLDASLLGRVIQNGRVARCELLCGNIRPDKVDEAWELIEMGLLADRYSILYTHSLQRNSFYSKYMPPQEHDERFVVDLEELTKEFVDNYKAGNINSATHPIMRTPLMKDHEGRSLSREPREVELANIAAVSQVHQCLPNSCGGDSITGKGCRFDFPKRRSKKTAVGIININAEQCEARVISKRTDSRVNNINPTILEWWRANHDCTALIDAAHSMRYCTKYAAKSSKHSEMYLHLLEHLRTRGLANLSQNVRHVLVQVFLASCAHSTFMGKVEVAYRVMQLPLVSKSFNDVEVEGCYWRATLLKSSFNQNEFVYSDRTKYAAYAERREKTTVLKGLSRKEVDEMSLREFCEKVNHHFKRRREQTNTKLGKRGQLKACVKGSGHWVLSKRKIRGHVRFSSILNSDLAAKYVPVDQDIDHSYKTFHEMPVEKRRQLARNYYELVCYVPWFDSPDKTFLQDDVRLDLEQNDPEANFRYSLKRCERYAEVYKRMWEEGKVAKPKTLWHYDLQSAYTMFLIQGHNSEVKAVRAAGEGKYNALFEPASELVGTDVDIRPAIYEEADDYDFPSADNYLLADHFKEILEQPPPSLQDIAIAYPMQNEWQNVEARMRQHKSKRFLAKPPPPSVPYDRLTPLQQKFIEVAVAGEDQVMYLLGKAGSGKSEVLKHVCQRMGPEKVQIGATTGKAASYFNGPTVHGMFGLSQNDFSEASAHLDPYDKKCQDNRVAYQDVELFIVDEVGMLPAHLLGYLEEVMCKTFNPKNNKINGKIPPFGGKRVIFVGDMAQLPPVEGDPLYHAKRQPVATRHAGLKAGRSAQGHKLYLNLLRRNVTIFSASHRNVGLLDEIADAIRNGQQTADHQNMLEAQYRRFPQAEMDRGIHYSNEMAMTNNWKTLWKRCKQTDRRLYVAKASYHETESNQLAVDILSSLSSKTYGYAPHLLCLSIGCEVRLVKNLDVAAGLVNSAVGNVVEVLYDAADAKQLVEGKHPPPYAVVVDFQDFTGFKNVSDPHPFPNRPTWVPILREKFTAAYRDLPANVRAMQQGKDCYRLQFPLDLATHVTAHRAQGATFRNSRIMVDLGLDNPSGKLPMDAGSIMYVAITRAVSLAYVFVRPIVSSAWEALGRSEEDKVRREEEAALLELAKDFAAGHGYLDLVLTESEWRPVYEGNEREWQNIRSQDQPPPCIFDPEKTVQYRDADFEAVAGGVRFQYRVRPVQSERHIGIDQGTRNFAVVAVDKHRDGVPTVVFAKLYNDLNLPARFKATNVVMALNEKRDIMSLMQLPGHDDPLTVVDRIVVHVEQMCVDNANSKTFGIDLARELQRLAPDPTSCVVRLSNPNLHCTGGPAFQLGKEIVQALQLVPVSTSEGGSDVNPANRKRNAQGETTDRSNNYKLRKQMSADVFKYVVEADAAKLTQMKLDLSEGVQQYHRQQIELEPNVRLHDLGDALMHALRGLLCGSVHVRAVAPTTPSLYNNRTVAVSFFPGEVYWVAVLVSWNGFVVEGMGHFDWKGATEGSYFLSHAYVRRILGSISMSRIPSSRELGVALKAFDGGNLFTAVDHIKVVIKQQTKFVERNLKDNREAGSFTNSTVSAMKAICDKVMGKFRSDLLDRKDKKLGSVYMRTKRSTGKKYQVTRSTGKHTNAVLCCLAWFRENLKDFVEQRRLTLTEGEKISFFKAIREVVRRGENRLELIQFSDKARAFILSDNGCVTFGKHTRNFADLLLISLSKNSQHVKSVAANYRTTARVVGEPSEKRCRPAQ